MEGMIITWRLEFLDGPRRGQTLDIFDGLLIGRQAECDLAILTGHLSRRHARFFCEGKSLFLEDLNSANGTFVNNIKISKQQIASGDHIRLDQIKLLISRINSNMNADILIDTHANQVVANSKDVRYDETSNRRDSGVNETQRENVYNSDNSTNGRRIPQFRKSIWVFAVTFVIVAVTCTVVIYRYYVNY